MPVRGILFDLDGTLLDTEGLILSSFQYATKKVLGRDFPDDVLMSSVGQPLEAQMTYLTSDPVVQKELLEVYREYNPFAKAFYHNYTASANEHAGLLAAGWRDEGVGWYGS